MKIYLVASDYDGTFRLTPSITRRNKTAVRQFRKQGGMFGFVTGRGINFTETLKKENITYDFLILDNGAIITDKDGNILYQSFLTEEAYAILESEMKKQPDVLKYDRLCEDSDLHLYFALFPTPKRTNEVAIMLNRKYGDILSAYANGRCLNVMTAGEGKKNGIQNLLNLYHIPVENSAVIGDDYNDLDMIAHFKGFAVANARREVKKAAGHCVFSVASLLHKILSNNI